MENKITKDVSVVMKNINFRTNKYEYDESKPLEVQLNELNCVYNVVEKAKRCWKTVKRLLCNQTNEVISDPLVERYLAIMNANKFSDLNIVDMAIVNLIIDGI